MNDWQAAIDEIIDLHTLRVRQVHEFSHYDYITRVQERDRVTMSVPTAERHLKRLVKAGVLGSEPDVIDFDGRRRRMYWKVADCD